MSPEQSVTAGSTQALPPNVQLISKVYLKKHTSQPRTYSLNKKDTKMVKDGVAKKL